jgi:hypothetical protein
MALPTAAQIGKRYGGKDEKNKSGASCMSEEVGASPIR